MSRAACAGHQVILQSVPGSGVWPGKLLDKALRAARPRAQASCRRIFQQVKPSRNQQAKIIGAFDKGIAAWAFLHYAILKVVQSVLKTSEVRNSQFLQKHTVPFRDLGGPSPRKELRRYLYFFNCIKPLQRQINRCILQPR